jgi:hypothetical protein
MTGVCGNPQAPEKYPQGDSIHPRISKENVKEARQAAQNPAQSGPDLRTLDPDLAHILDAWPTLPAHIKAAVLALVATTDAAPKVR